MRTLDVWAADMHSFYDASGNTASHASRLSVKPPLNLPPTGRARRLRPEKGFRAGNRRAPTGGARGCGYSALPEASSASSSATFSTVFGAPSPASVGADETCTSGADASPPKEATGEM